MDAKNEFVAMLCASLGERSLTGLRWQLEEIHPDSFIDWPESVQNLVISTWGWIMFGPNTPLAPVTPKYGKKHGKKLIWRF